MSPAIGRIAVLAVGWASDATTSCSVSLVTSRLPTRPSFEKPLGDLAADHAGGAGDEDVHISVPFDAPLMPGAQPQHGEECEHEDDGDQRAHERPAAADQKHDARHEEPPAEEGDHDRRGGDERRVARRDERHQSENPPSAEMMMPVVKALSSPAR